MGSISCHIMPIVINSLGGGHTHTQTHILTICTGSILRNQVRANLWPAHVWFKNNFRIKQNPTVTYYVTKDHIAMLTILF